MSHPRLEGDEYYSFVDEWVTAIMSRWPGKKRKILFEYFFYLILYISDTLIQFEDFKYPHAYNLLSKCKNNKQT